MQTISFKDFPNNKSVHLLGRFYETSEALFCDFSGSGISFSFIGVSFNVVYMATATDNEIDRPYINIIIDGKYVKKMGLYKPYGDIQIRDLDNKEHIVRLIKATEGQISHVGYKEIKIEGEFIQYKNDKRLKIEIYGDSLTAGYAVEGINPDSEFISKEENYIYSYAYLLGEELDAEVSSICAGGFPLYKSIYTSGYCVDNIPDLISKASFARGIKLNDCPSWDNSLFIPNLVIINLGANDSSVGEEHFSKEKYIKKAHSFFDELFSIYGENIKIIYMYGMIVLSGYILEAIKQAINTYRRKIYLFITDSLSVGGMLPGQGHPNKKMHRYASKQLSNYIKEVIGL